MLQAADHLNDGCLPGTLHPIEMGMRESGKESVMYRSDRGPQSVQLSTGWSWIVDDVLVSMRGVMLTEIVRMDLESLSLY